MMVRLRGPHRDFHPIAMQRITCWGNGRIPENVFSQADGKRMNKLRSAQLALLAVLAGCATGPGGSAPTSFDGNSWWNHIKVLAADDMEGRDTGSEGLKRAEVYVVSQLQAASVEPAGTKGYYQPVAFDSRTLREQDSRVALVRDGVATPLTLGEDANLGTRVDEVSAVAAPLVFAGYGLSIPENNYDDLAGLDLRGKVAVIITGSPETVPATVASHYQTVVERWKVFHKAGAVGIVNILNPASMDIPWPRIALNRLHPAMNLVGAEFQETAGEQLALSFNPAHAEKLFAGSGHSFAEIAELAKDRKPLPRFVLPVSIEAKTRFEQHRVESANIVAVVPGSDPALKNEYVVLSAHIDHLGIGEPIAGDRIYNGAMDNASGCAVLLDVAAALKKQRQHFKRSLLFVFVTGEEKGLLGSKYFSEHPTVAGKSLAADINIDMFLPLVPLKMLTVLGLAESDLGDMAREAAAANGVAVRPDPKPLRNIFIRSDQYSFIRHGVPALAMGIAPTTPEQEALYRDWITHRYHAPSDDLQQPVDLAAAGKYEDVIRTLLTEVANAPQAPHWKPDSFFRRYTSGG
jgi:Zn-dependent M28 family amino/carboxypeptidase